jgi:hypothetical protein
MKQFNSIFFIIAFAIIDFTCLKASEKNIPDVSEKRCNNHIQVNSTSPNMFTPTAKAESKQTIGLNLHNPNSLAKYNDQLTETSRKTQAPSKKNQQNKWVNGDWDDLFYSDSKESKHDSHYSNDEGAPAETSEEY